ncbi:MULTISPECIES: hypothetical protein [Pseudanabaena]|jgi:hypothetical protein|nr:MULTISPECIES: hypothetical protein [Pseudanabaena]MEA5489298.1 hypothetical protein [Pseudanabaena sp. CCNP1317]WGS74096.1 hypothetical protein OA858_08725 [Pseudanabaena galeata CCNP1313]
MTQENYLEYLRLLHEYGIEVARGYARLVEGKDYLNPNPLTRARTGRAKR